MKPIRIFLIRNLTTALFMSAYYRQEKMLEDDFRDICIIHWYKSLDSSDIRNQSFVNACKRLAGIISNEIIICPEQDKEHGRMSSRNIYRDRKTKIVFLETIKNLLHDNKIDPRMIKEVYHGNKTFHQYLKYLNPKIRLIGFEHGLSDIKGYLLRHDWINRFKNGIKTVLGGLFFIFYAYAQNDDTVVSLFAPKIKEVNPKIQIKYILAEYIKEVASDFAYDDFNDRGFLNANNHIGIVLISEGYKLAKNEEDCIRFHKACARYFLKEIKEVAPQINTVIFKFKIFDEFPPGIKKDFRDYFKDYNVFFFDEITKTNCPVEFYLDAIRPEVIFGDDSSALFYAKALIPAIETYTIHNYTTAYELEHFDRFLLDRRWIQNIFHEKYKSVFGDILPIETKSS